MKKMITKLAMVAIVVLFGNSLTAEAQVTPTTSGVTLLCSGSDLELPTPDAGYKWLLRYSSTPSTTPAGVTLPLNNKLAAADVLTGYYYLIKIGTAAGSCESEMQEIPVYKFAPLSVTFTADDYCEEAASSATFTGTATTTEANATVVYQWYTVAGSPETETKITTGGSASTFAPTITTAGSTTKYRLKVGYSVGGANYCATSFDKSVTVTAKPAKPTITVSGSSSTTF